MNTKKICPTLSSYQSGFVCLILMLSVFVVSCDQDVAGPADETVTSAEVSTLANVEEPCEEGFYSVTGNSPCEAAPVGRYVPEAGATEAKDCPLGTYQDETGQTSCKPAEPGSFVDFEGAAASSLCPVGSFTNVSGSVACTVCPEGTTTEGPGATACIFIVNDPVTKDDCKEGGWEVFGFKNQGQCVQFIETGMDSR